MKVCLLGPTYPFRGGVAHYTTALCHHLRERHEVVFISYRRQYPAFLFPGRSQTASGPTPLAVESEPLFDSLNPVSWRRIVSRIRGEQPDLVVFNWVTPFLAVPFWYIARGARRASDARIVMICHNVKQHEGFPAERWLTRKSLGAAHCLIVHSEGDAQNAKALVSGADIVKALLPTYGFLSAGSTSAQQARQHFRLPPGPILLFFGFVREYKGLRYLLEAMPAVRREVPEVHLLVVGEFWDDKRPYLELIDQLGIGDAVTVIDAYVPDDDVQRYFAAADLVVLPYVSATQSAIVQLAFGAGKPVVTTNVGGLPDVVTNNETGFLVEPRDPQALADAIAKALGDGTLVRLASNVRGAADRFSWERLVDTLQACAKPSRVGRAHLQSPPPSNGAREASGTARTGGGH